MEAELRPDEDELLVHAPEPWKHEGRYVRDALGTIVVRGRSPADARRIAAAINSTHGIPTEALEGWSAQDISDPHTRPDLEIELPQPGTAATELSPPVFPDLMPVARAAAGAASSEPESLVFERRVFQRRMGQMPVPRDRRTVERRRGARQDGSRA